MRKILAAILLSISLATHAEAPSYIGQHISTPEDQTAIRKVIEQFRTGIIDKNVYQLTSLMLNSNILFSSAVPPQGIRKMREKYDRNFDGIMSAGLPDFCKYLMDEKGAVEEKFYNIKITQDGHTAWVMFDYEFQVNQKTENYGIETWQLLKDGDEQWKIISVVWTVNLLKS